MTVSPLCQVKDGGGAYVATTNGVNVTPGDTITIHLIDTSANSWDISCITTDELSVAATVSAALVIDPIANTATFTAPVSGRTYRFRSRVNQGNGPDGKPLSSYSTTFCIYTLTTSGDRCIAVDETIEGDSTFGWIKVVNAMIRSRAADAAAILVLQTSNPQPLSLASDFTCTTSASGGATTLSIPVAVNDVWLIEFEGTVQCSSTGGVKFAIVGPTGATVEGGIDGEGNALTAELAARITDDASYFGVFSPIGATPEPIAGWARVKIDASHSGTLILSARPVVNAQTVTLKAGFTMKATKVIEV